MEVKTLNGDITGMEMTFNPVKSELPTRASTQKGLSAENREILDRIYTAHQATFIYWHRALDTQSFRENIKEHEVRTCPLSILSFCQ